jgi:hypothetical protein
MLAIVNVTIFTKKPNDKLINTNTKAKLLKNQIFSISFAISNGTFDYRHIR